MPSTTKPKTVNNPHNFVIVPSDQVQSEPSDTEITDLLRAVARHQSESVGRNQASTSSLVPAVDTTFRATAFDEEEPAPKRSFGRWFVRTAAAVVLAMGIGAAAMSWQTLGVIGKKAMVKWAPQFALSSYVPWDKLGLAAKSTPADEEAAEAAPAQAATPTETSVDGAVVNRVAAASTSPDQTQPLQAMARDLASANQQIETLKATIVELKASQQQLTRDLAKVSDKAVEPVAKPKVASTPPHPAAAAPVRKPPPAYAPSAMAPQPPPAYRPVYPTSQASAMPPPPGVQTYVPPPPSSQPMQLQPQADPSFGSAPRPPMPVQ